MTINGKINKLALVALLVAAPGLAQAYECSTMKSKQMTMSCAPGSALDAETNTCVPLASS